MPFSTKEIIMMVYGGYLVLLSIVTFIAYHADKKKAEKGKYRTKEATLLTLSFLGGAFGGYPAMLIFRHKTKAEHWYFTFVNILGILLHIAIMAVLYFLLKI